MSHQLSLVLFHSPTGRYMHTWARRESRIEQLFGLELVRYSAERAEAARFDGIFLADKVFFDRVGGNPDMSSYEPLTTLGALSAVTTKLGLIATASTTFTEPYNLARMLSQLDFLSNGRVAWNVVTSTDGAANFQNDLPPKAERYDQAQDSFEAMTALWDAWADDAVVLDRENGVWADISKISQPHYQGRYVQVRDALAMPRSPQGRPVIVQAGQSPEGMAFAARNADVVFTAQNHLPSAIEFRRRLRELAAANGRPDGAPRVLPGLLPIIAETQAEADDIMGSIADLLPLRVGLNELSTLLLGADLDGLDLDEPLPVERLKTLEEAAGHSHLGASRYPNMYRLVTEQRPTLRELVRTSSQSAGHPVFVGTATSVADQMQQWFEAEACDGFMISPPYMPEGLDAVCDLLVPELQRRGLFRTEYPGETLRDTLALARPDRRSSGHRTASETR
ncbi:NtaA/DmoA family FMN-dependent monooxygenase [Subtercola sp. YIM 133946]|uniref:NtaA/DmoA family FMN-dependent monooxygenase n=1 Tax=Subtercola sp. YIM 133946 TaxID=3118909 RepID=UPI002F95E659